VQISLGVDIFGGQLKSILEVVVKT
jgi:uncharacterized membrane protein (Fun14 family)